MNILICIPTRGFIYYKIANFVSKQQEMGFGVLYSSSSYGTEAARKKLTHTFLRFDYSHLFFLDDDVIPPSNVIASLLKHDKDIITASYPIMKDDTIYDSCSIKEDFGKVTTRLPFSMRGLREIDLCGLGACLIKRDVVIACQDDFEFKFDKDGDVSQSEDYYFCEKAKEKGFGIWCDFDVKCEHYKMIPLKGGE